MGQKDTENPRCNKCGILLNQENWNESHRNPKPRYFQNSGKFYATRLFVCKECWRKKVREGNRASCQRQKEIDPDNYFTRYRGIRLLWRGTFIRKMTSMEVRTVSEKAEEIAAREILPEEGFGDICWLHNHHAPVDILASKEGQCCAIDVTTASYKSFRNNSVGNKRAIQWLARNLNLRLLVVFVSPDLSRYIIKPIPEGRIYANIRKEDFRLVKTIRPQSPFDGQGTVYPVPQSASNGENAAVSKDREL